MGPIKAIATCFKKYACPKGRARRSEYWWFFGFYILLNILLFVTAFLICHTTVMIEVFYFSIIALFLLFLLPITAVAIRRAHDSGRSGWMLFVPIYNIVILLLPSDSDDNLWGPSHLYENAEYTHEEHHDEYQYPTDWVPFILFVIIGLVIATINIFDR